MTMQAAARDSRLAGKAAGRGWVVLLALVANYIVMLVSALLGLEWIFASGAALSYLLDARLMRRSRYLATRLGRNQMGVSVRFALRQLLLVVLVSGEAALPSHVVALLFLAIVTVHLSRAGYAELVQRTMQRLARPLQWRNLHVDGVPEDPPALSPPVPHLFGIDGARLVLHLDLLAMVGMLLTVGLGVSWALPVMLELAIVASLSMLWTSLRLWEQAQRCPTADHIRDRVCAAVELLQPEVILYFSNPNSATYALNVWLPIVDRIHRPTIIVVRESGHLKHLSKTTTPLVVVPKTRDLERLPLATIRAALYPTNVIKNTDMLRVPGIRHAFINHGDSDKVSSFNPVARVFDEIWVAGEAGRDRYIGAGEGFRPEQIHVVGRPQLAEIATARVLLREEADLGLTVLYAPTWEGFFDDADYSSLAPMGERIVKFLLAADPPVRLLFKPHPTTGIRNPSAATARSAVERLLRDAPGPHTTIDPGPHSLYAAFNEADVLITDVSSVITDFLASRKPYIVTNPRGIDDDEFHAAYPAAKGGHLLDPDCSQLTEFLNDIIGDDRLQRRREALATYLVGSSDVDQVQRFLAAVDDVIDRNTYRPVTVDETGAPVLVPDPAVLSSPLAADDTFSGVIDDVATLPARRVGRPAAQHHRVASRRRGAPEETFELTLEVATSDEDGMDAETNERQGSLDSAEEEALREASGVADGHPSGSRNT
jgi:hypothetical protein